MKYMSSIAVTKCRIMKSTSELREASAYISVCLSTCSGPHQLVMLMSFSVKVPSELKKMAQISTKMHSPIVYALKSALVVTIATILGIHTPLIFTNLNSG